MIERRVLGVSQMVLESRHLVGQVVANRDHTSPDVFLHSATYTRC